MSEESGYPGCAAFGKRKNKQKGIRDEEAGAGTTKSKEEQNPEAEKSADCKSRNSRAKRHGLQ